MPDESSAGDVLLFPGQGSQHPAMRAAVADAAPDLLTASIELLGTDPFEQPAESTRFTQPAIFCASIASWRTLHGSVRPVAFAGHSFGEFAALAAAGAVDVIEALKLVVLRGRLTEQVAASVDGGMLAVLGVRAATAYAAADRHGAVVANDNCPGQLVLSGPEPALGAVAAEMEGMGAQFRRLAVQGPFHSPLMAEAVEPFADALAKVTFRPTGVPVYCGMTAAPFEDPRRQLAEALVSPVRWREIVEHLGTTATRFVEVAPGEVLSKMVRRTVRGVPRLVGDSTVS